MLPALSPRSSTPSRRSPHLHSELRSLLYHRAFVGLSARQLGKTVPAVQREKPTHDDFSRCCCSKKRRSGRLARTEEQMYTTCGEIRSQLRGYSACGGGCEGSRVAWGKNTRQHSRCMKRVPAVYGDYTEYSVRTYNNRWTNMVPPQWSSMLTYMRF